MTFISQLSCAPTFAGRSAGQVTDSGLLPAASVILALIWLATSLLLTECDDDPIEHEQAPALAISPKAAPEISNARTIE
ncbi:hypothetical protein NIIDMKKI_52240 [Mycobacterium kansasii]|uniref:Uncharacterized protein n=1 Tax=Mycobacterium kansasii TaxID=1768 RepID=A0A7G1IMZ6_MYCKA|nr:hypothetical protein NIIDMKKI_52240 [Mycobacterium kansasii]